MNRKRLYYILSIIVLIPVGLLSRKYSWIPVETGDVLWAMMVFCLFRLAFIQEKLWKVAIYSLLFSFIDEFAQLITLQWLVEVRSTTLGHLVLGQGFEWIDLVAYSIGIGIVYWVASKIEK